MSHVTGLRLDLHRPGYVILFLDGQRFASLPVELLRSLGLESGAAVSEPCRRQLDDAARDEAAYRAAQASLARRPRARQDLLRRLLLRGHSRHAAEVAVQRLERLGHLDDRRYTSHFASIRVSKGHGRSRILRDLLAAGVDRGLAEQVTDEVLQDSLDPLREIRSKAERRAAQMTNLPPATKRRRLLAFLARRGHQGAEARRLVEKLVAG